MNARGSSKQAIVGMSHAKKFTFCAVVQVMKVVIAGAGLVGAATAIALRQAGHECTLYDRVHLTQTANGANEAVDFGEVGGAVLLNTSCLRLLKTLGVLGEVLANSVATPIVRMFNMDGSRPISIDHIRLTIHGGDKDQSTQRTVHILRSTLHGILIKAAFNAGVQTIVGKKLIGVVQTESTVTARFTDGTSASGDLLIGADGIHSATRQAVFGVTLKAQYTGVIGYIGVVNLKQHNIDLDVRCGIFLDRRDKHMVCVFKVSEEMGVVQVWTFSDLNPEEPQDDSYRPYNDLPKHSARLADFMENWGAPANLVEMMRKASRITPVSIYDLPDLDAYHKGRVLLIGDAAHGMVPHAGLGLATGLEDVGFLMELLKRLPKASDLFKVLELFSRLCIPRGTETSRFSRFFAAQYYAKSRLGAGFSHFLLRVCVFALNHKLMKFPRVVNCSEQVSRAIAQYSC
ncbi:hypothetical protein HDU98_003135 [Podochytrium sp. JEL0797]|nr:hypothetical protein HDU98_003135 [Podochytrium sp. JEL0797]